MPPKATTGANGTVTLSEKEMQVLALSWQCMESEPKIDMTKLALLAGYTEGSASVTFGKIKRKLKSLTADVPGATPLKSSPKKRTAKAASEGDDDEEPATPSKAKKPRTPKKKAAPKTDGEGTGSGSGSASPVKKEVKEEPSGGMGGFDGAFDGAFDTVNPAVLGAGSDFNLADFIVPEKVSAE